jgi:hypothetical protein
MALSQSNSGLIAAVVVEAPGAGT